MQALFDKLTAAKTEKEKEKAYLHFYKKVIPLWENTSEEEIAEKQQANLRDCSLLVIPTYHNDSWQEAAKMKFQDAVEILQWITTPPPTKSSSTSSRSKKPKTSTPSSRSSGSSRSAGSRAATKEDPSAAAAKAAEDQEINPTPDLWVIRDVYPHIPDAHEKLEVVFKKPFTTLDELTTAWQAWAVINTPHKKSDDLESPADYEDRIIAGRLAYIGLSQLVWETIFYHQGRKDPGWNPAKDQSK